MFRIGSCFPVAVVCVQVWTMTVSARERICSDNPIAGFLRRGTARHARAEINLCFRVTEAALPLKAVAPPAGSFCAALPRCASPTASGGMKSNRDHECNRSHLNSPA